MGRSFTPAGGAGTPFEGQELLAAFTCPPLTKDVNDYRVAARAFDNASVIYLGAVALVAITGLQGATANRELTLMNVSADPITLKANSGSSAAGNRFNFAADVVLSQWQAIKLVAAPGAGGWANAAGAGAGAGATRVPGTIPDLVYWLQADLPLMSAGNRINALQNSCPWLMSYSPNSAGASVGVTRSATVLNGLGVYLFPGSAQGNYVFPESATPGAGPLLKEFTGFVVFNPTALGGIGSFICGTAADSLEFDIDATGHLSLTSSFNAIIGASTTVIPAGTFVQGNATYDGVSGNFAFRVSRAAAGAGSNVQAITTGSNGVGFDPETGSQFLSGLLAEFIVYNRVLTAGEIATVETYLNGKWGV